MAQRHIIDVDIAGRADGLVPTWDDGTQTHQYGSAAGLPVAKNWFTDNFDLRDYPASPNALDDEFEGGGAIDAKWTAVNNPASGDAFNQTDLAGYLHVGLLELGTDDFANAIQLYQTAPSGAAVATYIARLAIANKSGTPALTDAAEFAAIGIALINSVNSQAIGVGLQFNDAHTGGNDNLPLAAVGFEDLFTGFGGTFSYPTILPGKEIYVRLRKTTSAAYTSANTYEMDFSPDGRAWQNIATGSKTFTTACDRVGFLIRRPKSATGTPYAEAIADFFRRTV